MKIGVDAKWYFDGPPSGKRVVRALTDAMIASDTRNEYVLFLDQKSKSKKLNFTPGPNVTLCYVWAGNNMLSNIFVMPLRARRFKLDAILYQNFASPFGKSKKIAYIHDVLFLSNPEFYTAIERLYFSPLKFLTRRSHSVITVSEEEKKRLLRFGFSMSADKIQVAHHGVDEHFTPLENYPRGLVDQVRTRYQLPAKFLLFVGRLNLRKNVDNLLRAIPLMKEKNIPLVIVGDADWKASQHIQTLKASGLEGRVIFTGAVYENLGVMYALSTIFCFPSFAESFGLPPLEAMACGIPVVVSNTTSLPEICGEAGTYVDPGKPQMIATAIDNLLTNGQLYEEKKKAGLKQASQFTWHQAASTVLRTIESTVNKTSP